MENAKEKINRIRFEMMMDSPFFGNLLMHLPTIITDKVKTFATDGENFIVNEKYLNNINDSECKYDLLHSLFHIILGHIKRGIEYKNDKLFHIACDIVVDANIEHLFYEYDGLRLNYQIKNAYMFTADQIYKILLKERERAHTVRPYERDEAHQKIVSTNCMSIKDVAHTAFPYEKDSHTEWYNNINAKEKADRIETLFDNYIKEETNKNKDYENLPVEFRKFLINRRINNLNWRETLKDFIEEDVNDYTFDNPDARYLDYDFVMPSFTNIEEKIRDCYFFIDVSGSMSDEQVEEFVVEIKNCLSVFNGKIDGYVAFFNTSVVTCELINNFDITKFRKLNKNGGTSFINIYKYIESIENKERIRSIILTDGKAIFPNKAILDKYKTLWIINDENFYYENIDYVIYGDL